MAASQNDPPLFCSFSGSYRPIYPPAPRGIAPKNDGQLLFGARFFGGRGGKLGGMAPKMSKKGGGHFGTQPY